jgi:F0F1-type ATP synthase membrane subunit b/b'
LSAAEVWDSRAFKAGIHHAPEALEKESSGENMSARKTLAENRHLKRLEEMLESKLAEARALRAEIVEAATRRNRSAIARLSRQPFAHLRRAPRHA